jgi:hypothetical protein
VEYRRFSPYIFPINHPLAYIITASDVKQFHHNLFQYHSQTFLSCSMQPISKEVQILVCISRFVSQTKLLFGKLQAYKPWYCHATCEQNASVRPSVKYDIRI